MGINKFGILGMLTFAVAALLAIPGLAFADQNVAKVGDVEYPSIQAAVDAAEDGDTVVVIADHEIECVCTSENFFANKSGEVYSLIQVVGKTITIDLNGKKLSAYPSSGQNITFFGSKDSGDLTLVDKRGGSSVDMTATTPVFALLFCYDGGKMTVEGGSYSLNLASDALVYSQNNDVVTINGGNYFLGNEGDGSNGIPWIFGASGKFTQHINVNGGTFNADIIHQYYFSEVSAPKEKALRDNGDGTWTMVNAVAYVDEREYTDKWYTNRVGYATLADAIAAVEQQRTMGNVKSDPEDVHLLQDCVVNETILVDESFTLYLEGHDVIWKGESDDPIFDIEGEKTLSIVKASDGQQGGSSEAPEREGYTFVLLSDRIAGEGSVEGLEITYIAEPITYTVKFNANGGSGTMANVAFVYDEAQALTANTFAREGYAFTGWAKDANAGVADYVDEESVKNLTAKAGGIVELSAMWEPIAYTVKFNANGGSGTMADMAFVYDEVQPLAANAFTREGYVFDGWNTKADLTGTTFEDKKSVGNLTAVDGEAITLYAMWAENAPLPDTGAGGKGALAETGDDTPAIALIAVIACAAVSLIGARRLKA